MGIQRRHRMTGFAVMTIVIIRHCAATRATFHCEASRIRAPNHASSSIVESHRTAL